MKDTLQDPAELTAFVDLLKREGVRSYLEIGANAGGTLRRVGETLDAPSRIVCVDLDGLGSIHVEARRSLKAIIAGLHGAGHEAMAIFGDSTDPTTVEKVRALSPFDCVLIDANHTLPFVTMDWENYGPMARMVAFHDIAWRRAPEWAQGSRIDVPEFWNSIKGGYRHEEFKMCPTGKNNGIGVLWRC